MKKIMLAIYVILSNILAAQDSTLIFIEAGRNVSEVLTPARIYRFPKFISGKILYRDGTQSEGMLNYNFLNAEIEFISPANDTLAIAKNQMLNIKEVLIDTQSFFYDDGYMELVVKTAFGKLVKKQTFVVIKREKIGGYNQPAPSSAIESYGSFTDNYGSFVSDLKIKENITLALRSNYFIGDQFNLFLPATKKNMMDLYPSKKDRITEYLDKNAVDFKKGKGLKQMFETL
jgi:hypothetical protein